MGYSAKAKAWKKAQDCRTVGPRGQQRRKEDSKQVKSACDGTQ